MNICDATAHINYNPLTGVIKRISRANSNGSIDHYGYLVIKIKGKQWKAHRLAWAKFYNREPQNVIDHINGNKTDNRISNLRDVPQSANVRATKRKQNKLTGKIGIHYDTVTNGLIAKYTTRYQGKTYRFRHLNDAINFRESRGLPV